MMLYHGSDREIPVPDLLHSRANVDFGQGFYTTPIREQAVKWCGKFKRRGKPGIVSCYSFDERALSRLKVLQFDTYDARWLEFILSCRSGKDCSDYDLVVGGVANDKVFNTIELYLDGLIETSEALGRLRYEKPNLQICFRTPQALEQCLRFEGSEQV